MKSYKILDILRSDPSLQNSFAKELKISKILAQLLINRGMKTVDEADKFLNVKLAHLHSPNAFAGMGEAKRLVHQALLRKDRVMVCGDYDVDGLTALSLVKRTLSSMGLHVEHHLPHRVKDGYGIHREIVRIAIDKKIKLLVSVDCGISNFKEVEDLRREGIEVIITDHHEPTGQDLPSASVIINAKVKKSGYPYRDLAGVGVAYKFCQGVSAKLLFEDLDIVSLGTIADVVPLHGENRIIAKEGLSRLKKTTKAGLRALIESARVAQGKISATSVSFMLGPRINASGRVDSSETSFSLLMCEEMSEARELAGALERFNRQRQKIEADMLQEAQDLINHQVNFKEHQVIVVAKEGWHQGVLGVVASKLSDKFYRPTIIISIAEPFCKGSGRSIANFHLFDALKECQHSLHAFGGHAHAAGLVIERRRIDEFRRAINLFAKDTLRIEDLLPSLKVDMVLSLADLSDELIDEIQRLEPFGTDNPEPLFFTPNLSLKGKPQVMGREALKFWVTDGATTCQAIGFKMGQFCQGLSEAKSLDIVYTLKMDSWQGKDSLLLEVKELVIK